MINVSSTVESGSGTGSEVEGVALNETTDIECLCYWSPVHQSPGMLVLVYIFWDTSLFNYEHDWKIILSSHIMLHYDSRVLVLLK